MNDIEAEVSQDFDHNIFIADRRGITLHLKGSVEILLIRYLSR